MTQKPEITMEKRDKTEKPKNLKLQIAKKDNLNKSARLFNSIHQNTKCKLPFDCISRKQSYRNISTNNWTQILCMKMLNTKLIIVKVKNTKCS